MELEYVKKREQVYTSEHMETLKRRGLLKPRRKRGRNGNLTDNPNYMREYYQKNKEKYRARYLKKKMEK